MELKETKKHENPLFNRKEIVVVVESISSPKIKEVEQALSEKYSLPVENIRVKTIKGNFGSNQFSITANIYSSKEDKDKTEVTARKTRKTAATATSAQ
jgi:ribosomal protein S24E